MVPLVTIILVQKILVDLIMIQVYAKIGMIQVIVYLVIAVFIYMIEVIIKMDGNYKKILKSLSVKDGKE